MTDKPTEQLSLVERAAKKLSESGSAAVGALPASSNFVERAAQRATTGARVPNATEAKSDTRLQTSDASAFSDGYVAHDHSLAIPQPTTGKQIKLDFRALRQSGMITPDNMASTLSNEFRGIKRRLLQKVRAPNTRATVNNLIMVSSSLPAEGKTFSSVNLALSLAAERGLNVLLIDADVIRPSVGKVFVTPPREGLTDLLTGGVKQVSDVLYRCTDVPNLSVIFAGAPASDSPELISSGRMAELCRDLSASYTDRVVIIDTPPVLASPEPAILASYVHQLVMVVAADQTDKHQLRIALEAVSACQNVSLLFNKAPMWNEVEYAGYYGYASSPPVAAEA